MEFGVYLFRRHLLHEGSDRFGPHLPVTFEAGGTQVGSVSVVVAESAGQRIGVGGSHIRRGGGRDSPKA